MKPVPFVKIRSHDIMISGKNDEEHLETVFNKGLKLKLKNVCLCNPKSHI